MTASRDDRAPPRVIVIADVQSNAQSLIERVLRPVGIHAWAEGDKAPPPDVLVVDVTQLRGDPLAGLENWRASGDLAPAIVLAAHFPPSHLREMLRLGVRDILIKPYRPADLCRAIYDLSEGRSAEANTRVLVRRLEMTREQARRRSQEIRLLSEIGRAVVRVGDLDQILTRVVEAASFFTNAEEASIYLVDPNTQDIVLRASKQVGQRHAALKRLRVTDTLAGEVFQTGQPVLRQPSPGGSQVKVQTGFMVQSLIKVPIHLQKRVVGVLGVYNRSAARSFHDHHMTLLLALSDWAGVALEHAMLMRRSLPTTSTEGPPTPLPAGMRQNLDHALVRLENLLRGVQGPLREAHRQELMALRRHLLHLRTSPGAKPKTPPPKEDVDLPHLVREVVSQMRMVASRRGVELRAEPSPPISAFPGSVARTRLVIAGLVAAAIRRTTKGRVVLEAHRFKVQRGRSDGLPLPARVHLPDGRWVAVTVADTSSGLSPDTLHALTAGKNPASSEEPSGLSMADIRALVDGLGGRLWHEDSPAGTTITFAIPVH